MNSNSWHLLVIDGREGNGGGGVTTLLGGCIFVDRRPFDSVEEARAHVRELIRNDTGGLFRHVVDLSLELCYNIVDHLSVTRRTYLTRGPGAYD